MLKHKIVVIAALMLLLWLPVGVIHNLVLERAELNQQVQQEISTSTSGEQTLVGPVLVQQLELRKTQANHSVTDQIQWQVAGALELNVQSDAQVEQRSRGLYRVRVYQSQHQIQAEFAPQTQLPTSFAPEGVTGQDQLRQVDSYLAFAVSDVRGLSSLPKVRINGTERAVIAGSGLKAVPEGVRVPVSPEELAHGFTLTMQLDLQGSGRMELLPTGHSSRWQLQSNWPDPAFVGRFLPQQRDVSDAGFAARWQSTQLSNPTLLALQGCAEREQCSWQGKAFEVNLIEAVDPYQQNERAVKYAILVIVLSFAWFYLAEILQTKPLHLMQYLLVGLTLVMFYLLLLSLSEVVGFALAYSLASGACALLLGYYLTAALKSARQGLAMAAAYGVLQGLLYLILQAETFALLSGSLLLFATLALLMSLTRHVDWQAMFSNSSATPVEAHTNRVDEIRPELL